MVRVCSLFMQIWESERNKSKGGQRGMELDYFKDKLFDLLNDSEDGWTTANWPYAMDVAITSNLRRRFFYKVSGWNRLDSPQGTKSPWNASRGSLSSQKTEQEQIQQNNVYDTMIFSENLFPLESDCGIMKLSTNRNREVNLYEWFCYSFS